MSDKIDSAELKKEIEKILKNANLNKISTKEVRQKLEKKFKVDLMGQKEEIGKITMDIVNTASSSDEEEEPESPESDEPTARPKRKTKAPAKKATGKVAKKGGSRGKGGGYTRAYKLSPALSSLMGETELPRHEVVKRVWAMIKEKNLYDPNNKQFAICDEGLYKVIGTKRFRTFGMMKYLKNHFIDD